MIAVHCGIGNYLQHLDSLCARALKEDEENDPVNVVMFLEKDPRTNCGIGSSLTEDGDVECEGAYMKSDGLIYGAVGALSNSLHPSLLSKKLASSTDNRSLVWPLVVVGEGANKLALSMEVATCSQEHLKCKPSESAFNQARLQLERFDTVGSIKISDSGGCEASVSSGGILLKKTGRLGHCTTFGAGIWAEERKDLGISVAITLSGCGECIVRTRLAEKIAADLFKINDDDIPSQVVEASVRSHFVESPLLSPYAQGQRKVGGLIGVRKDGLYELIAFHNTESLPLAYSSGLKTKKRNLIGSNKTFVYEVFPINNL